MSMNEKKSPADIRREQELAAKKAARQELIKKIGIWVGVAAVLGGMVWALAHYGASGGSSLGGGTLEDPVSNLDHTKGNSLAQVTLVEYSDFECPACGAYYPVIKSLAAKYGDRVLFVYRHYPLSIHRNSNLAARASEAADKQGKFWAMHDRLFDEQAKWSKSDDVKGAFIGYAESLGLNREQFINDLDSAEAANRVNRDLTSGEKSRVQGTPTFYLNNQKLNLRSYGDLEQSIQTALAEKK